MKRRIKKSYKIRLYPSIRQKALIEKTLGCVRQIYNDFLAMCIESYEKDRTFKIKKFTLIKLLPEYKEGFPYLKEVDSIALQQTVLHLHSAYSNFFRHNADFPKFKKKKNDHAYTTMNVNNSVRIIGDEIQLPKLGKVIMVNPFAIPSSFTFTTVTISREGKYYYVSLNGEQDNEYFDEEYDPRALDEANSVGLDFSLSNLFVDSEGNHIEMPDFYQDIMEKLAKLQRKASRCKKDSQNYKKLQLKIKNLHVHTANQRKDFLHKLSRKYTNKYDYVFVETLDLKEMSSKDNKMKFGIEVHDRGFNTFLTYLKYKLEWMGKKLIKIDKYFPSSQLCNECGYQNKSLTLSDRSWTCPRCGKHHDRDINAAINIKMQGLKLLNN